MVRRVQLDEKEHAFNILQRLNSMKVDQKQCDFIVSVNNDEYHAHRNILSAGTDYFNAMLTHDTRESQLGKVEMMDVDSECVKGCIDYIYTGKADVPDGKIEELIHVAHLMQLDTLFEGLVKIFLEGLNVDTLWETKRIAELYGLDNLLAKCQKFAGENFNKLCRQPGFLEESKDFVFFMIKAEKCSVTEEEKLIFALQWIRHKPERAKYFADVIHSINLKEVSVSYRKHLIENESLLLKNPKIFKLFSLSIISNMEIESRNTENFYDNSAIIIFDENADCLQHFNVRSCRMQRFGRVKVKRFASRYSAVFLHPHIYVLSQDKSVLRLGFSGDISEWERVEDMIADHGWHPPVVSHNGALFVMGGSHECCTAASEQYFPDRNKWIQLKSMPMPIEKAVLVSLNEYIYSAGGFRNGKYLNSFSRFSPFQAKSIDLPSMPKAKRYCGASALGNKIYIMGGCHGEKTLIALDNLDAFDVSTFQWSSLTPMNAKRSLFQAFCIDGAIYAFGGWNDDGYQSVEKYDTEQDKWTNVKILGSSTPSIGWAVHC